MQWLPGLGLAWLGASRGWSLGGKPPGRQRASALGAYPASAWSLSFPLYSATDRSPALGLRLCPPSNCPRTVAVLDRMPQSTQVKVLRKV